MSPPPIMCLRFRHHVRVQSSTFASSSPFPHPAHATVRLDLPPVHAGKEQPCHQRALGAAAVDRTTRRRTLAHRHGSRKWSPPPCRRPTPSGGRWTASFTPVAEQLASWTMLAERTAFARRSPKRAVLASTAWTHVHFSPRSPGLQRRVHVSALVGGSSLQDGGRICRPPSRRLEAPDQTPLGCSWYSTACLRRRGVRTAGCERPPVSPLHVCAVLLVHSLAIFCAISWNPGPETDLNTLLCLGKNCIADRAWGRRRPLQQGSHSPLLS